MATASGRASTALIERLVAAPHRFDWFQAVRMLRLRALEEAQQHGARPLHSVGEDHSPDQEIVRFRALPSHTFPPSSIHSVERRSGSPAGRDAVEMVVAFMGLTGPSGVLPQHYTQLMIDRVRRKDYSLRDFYDLFNHRLISFFYRAWEKYRVPVGYERAHYGPSREEELFLTCLNSIVGFGTGGLRGRLEISDEVFLYYAGLFAHHPRNFISLENMLGDYFELPVRVIQFHGQWLYLRPQDQTRMPTEEDPDGWNSQLGVSVVVGERVWGVENSFRLRLGPLRYNEFLSFTPEGAQLERICQLTRSYVGAEFDFEVQPVLRADETPWCELRGDDDRAVRLGWNTWLRGEEMNRDPDDAVFHHEGGPRYVRSV